MPFELAACPVIYLDRGKKTVERGGGIDPGWSDVVLTTVIDLLLSLKIEKILFSY